MPLIFDYWGVQLNAAKADGQRIVINWNFTEPEEQYALNLSNSALTYRAGWQAPDADLIVTLTRATLDAIILGETDFQTAAAAGKIKLDGNPAKLAELLGMLDTFTPDFPIVTP